MLLTAKNWELCNFSFRFKKDARARQTRGGGAGRVDPGGARESPQGPACHGPWGAHPPRGGGVWGPVGAKGGPQVPAGTWVQQGAWDPQGMGPGAGAPSIVFVVVCWGGKCAPHF